MSFYTATPAALPGLNVLCLQAARQCGAAVLELDGETLLVTSSPFPCPLPPRAPPALPPPAAAALAAALAHSWAVGSLLARGWMPVGGHPACLLLRPTPPPPPRSRRAAHA